MLHTPQALLVAAKQLAAQLTPFHAVDPTQVLQTERVAHSAEFDMLHGAQLRVVRLTAGLNGQAREIKQMTV
jgi:hypothetical protein